MDKYGGGKKMLGIYLGSGYLAGESYSGDKIYEKKRAIVNKAQLFEYLMKQKLNIGFLEEAYGSVDFSKAENTKVKQLTHGKWRVLYKTEKAKEYFMEAIKVVETVLDRKSVV